MFDDETTRQLGKWGKPQVEAFLKEINERLVLRFDVGLREYDVKRAVLQTAFLLADYKQARKTGVKSFLSIDTCTIAKEGEREAFILTGHVREEMDLMARYMQIYEDSKPQGSSCPTVAGLCATLRRFYEDKS